ncbi:MAG TPA: 3-phosphoshikimate 1-carboxyvinyltransferase [Acidimicrobiia bacterium]|nr:3-phosphoshikimate 1-carboxyvinyltransferase [Acidimicrobiia bacterium]
MTSHQVSPGGPLKGRVQVPGDKSISHRVLMLAALAHGESRITGLSNGQDVLCTLAIIEALGAQVTQDGEVLVINGGTLVSPPEALDVGNSGTGMRLLAGLLAGLGIEATLDGDASIRSRPMDRIIDPLTAMGAIVTSVDGQGHAPLTISASPLSGIEYVMPVASAQVKSAVLLAGLNAQGPTTVREPIISRAHTEELMAACGLEVTVEGLSVTVQPGRPQAFTHQVAGDPSQSAFWAVGAAIVDGSAVVVENVYQGPARTGFVEVLKRMGADLTHDPVSGDLTVCSGPLEATTVTAAEVPGLVDEVPVLAIAAACAIGTTVFEGLAELRVKESDRLATVEAMLVALGAQVEVTGDQMAVTGGPLAGGLIETHRDHRIAMAGAIAGLVASGSTRISDWDAVATSYPNFGQDLAMLRSTDV